MIALAISPSASARSSTRTRTVSTPASAIQICRSRSTRSWCSPISSSTGMIKVKGQLGEMAKCLEDPEPRVSDLAKLFFSELATKENAVYNNLPDIISHLSIGKHAVDEETFARTMKFIFTFIDKEKQAENVVEKLCQRFRLTNEERQWRDIAFCLSLLPYKSERSSRNLSRVCRSTRQAVPCRGVQAVPGDSRQGAANKTAAEAVERVALRRARMT